MQKISIKVVTDQNKTVFDQPYVIYIFDEIIEEYVTNLIFNAITNKDIDNVN